MMKKVLIIEDDLVVRENISTLLKEEGYDTYSCKDGLDGINTALKVNPDLIICDIMMPNLSGYDVLKKVSSTNNLKKVPFIFLTAKIEKDDIRNGMILGADDYLFKPFDADDLLLSISSRLKRIEMFKEKEDEKLKYEIDDSLFIKIKEKTYLIKINEIVAITAAQQYSKIETASGKRYIIRKSISYWEKCLPSKKFLRIHRSSIINIDYLIKMETWYNSSYILHLKNIEKPFIISRRYSTKLREKLLH